ncbi:hypothetical protein B484DRAFT_409327 [Ochromonadaceae sp. CCMP2298]|nr:hypothetical protein B484DRAFT_409327 [Ochromonadaceae sp. CCMP2298]
MFSGRHALPLGKDEQFVIDRDGTRLQHILNFLRAPEGYKMELTEDQAIQHSLKDKAS